MLVFEYKLKGKQEQFNKIDEAIRTGQFIRNACLNYWKENHEATKNDLQKYCAVCGEVVKKSLSVRTHFCPHCRTVLDRDENAAINILIKAIEILENTVGHRSIYAQGQFDLCLIGAILSDKLSGKTRKGKN